MDQRFYNPNQYGKQNTTRTRPADIGPAAEPMGSGLYADSDMCEARPRPSVMVILEMIKELTEAVGSGMSRSERIATRMFGGIPQAEPGKENGSLPDCIIGDMATGLQTILAMSRETNANLARIEEQLG